MKYLMRKGFVYLTETAINIGYSCMLLTENMIDVFIINGKDRETVQNQIIKYQTKIDESSPSNSIVNGKEVELKGLPKGEGHVRFAENTVN